MSPHRTVLEVLLVQGDKKNKNRTREERDKFMLQSKQSDCVSVWKIQRNLLLGLLRAHTGLLGIRSVYKNSI